MELINDLQSPSLQMSVWIRSLEVAREHVPPMQVLILVFSPLPQVVLQSEYNSHVEYTKKFFLIFSERLNHRISKNQLPGGFSIQLRDDNLPFVIVNWVYACGFDAFVWSEQSVVYGSFSISTFESIQNGTKFFRTLLIKISLI